MRIVAIGDNCLDVYVDQDLATVGGNALNVAVNWARAGLTSCYYGAIGDDRAASIIRTVMSAVGLDPRFLVTIPGPTGVTLIRLVRNDREFLFEEFGVGASWVPSADVITDLQAFDWIHTAGPLTTSGLVQTLVAGPARVSVDLSTTRDFPQMDGVDIAFCSWTGPLDRGAHMLAESMISAGAVVAVVTCGAHGSLAHTNAAQTIAEAIPVSPVDTCGAGDSYISAFVHSYLRGLSTPDCLLEATRTATKTCMHLGSFRQQHRTIPDWLKRDYYPSAVR